MVNNILEGQRNTELQNLACVAASSMTSSMLIYMYTEPFGQLAAGMNLGTCEPNQKK